MAFLGAGDASSAAAHVRRTLPYTYKRSLSGGWITICAGVQPQDYALTQSPGKRPSIVQVETP